MPNNKHLEAELKEALLSIGKRCVSLPDRDTRSPDEILDYDSDGLPGMYGDDLQIVKS